MVKISSLATVLFNKFTPVDSLGWNKDDRRKSVLFRCLFFRFFGQSARSKGFLTSDGLPTTTYQRHADINKFQSPDLRFATPSFQFEVPYHSVGTWTVFALHAHARGKVPSNRIGSSCKWYHSIGLEKDINHYRSSIFIFSFEKTSKFWVASYKNASNHPTCWDHGLYGHKWRSFPPNHAPKMRGSLDYGSWLECLKKENQHPAIQIKIEQPFGGFVNK